MKEQILEQIIKKQDELIKWLIKYNHPESQRFYEFLSKLASLKSQLLKQTENYPVYDENYLKECIEKSRLNDPEQSVTTHDLKEIDRAEEEKR